MMFHLLLTVVYATGLWSKALATTDPLVADANSVLEQMPPCSCDCCSVTPRLPSEQTDSLRVKCSNPALDQQTDICPSSCAASEADVVLTSAKSGMDYARYCQYKCKPSSEITGTMCTRLDAMETQQTFEFDGNGNANSAIYGASDTGGPSGWSEEIESHREAETTEVANMEAAQALKEHVTYDVQKVIENKLRAETASSMARASAAEARAKADLAAADRAATEASEANGVGRFSAAGQELAIEAEAARDEAAREAGSAESTMRAVQAAAQNVAAEAAKEAVVEIKKQAAPAAKELADAHAQMWGWDKPKFWPKVEAVRAANPYQAQMTVAVQRMGEYEGYSQSELGKAQGDQAKAVSLASQANAMEAQGDKMGAVTIRHEIDGLLSSAKGHEATATSDWNVADTMRKSVPQWQEAAMKAATYSSWKWSNVFTPPPEYAFLQKGSSSQSVHSNSPTFAPFNLQ